MPHSPSYSAYKSSGVEWLGDVPADWEQLPGRACYTEKKALNVGMQESTVLSLSYGRIVVRPPEKLRGLVPESFETYQIVEPGDIVVRSTDLQNDWNSLRFGLCRRRGIITAAYMCLKANGAMLREYGHLLLHAYDLKKVFYGLGSGLRQNLSWDDFRYLPCLVPPLAEQRAIVCYLDYVGRRIQGYIEVKENLIAQLQEARQATIQRAVTRGLDSSVPLKPSGVEWLGDVPVHWEMRRLRYLIEGGLTYGANAAAEHDNPNWPRYLRITDFGLDGKLRDDTFRSLPPEIARDYLVKPGDLLLARSGATVGKAFLVTSEIGQACHAGYLIRARPKGDLIAPGFLFAFTQSSAFSSWKDSVFIIATIQNISAEKYANLPVPTPPLEEQQKIVAHLDKTTAYIDAAIDSARRQVEFMTEYRASLIAHVVTGKLDVRAAVEQLPQEARELAIS